MRNVVLPIAHGDVVSHALSIEEFEVRARRVQDWDLIIVLYSYGSGSDVLDHPALASRTSNLRYEVKGVDGFLNEGVRTVIVIRDERIVEQFYLRVSLLPDDGNSIVLSRDD